MNSLDALIIQSWVYADDSSSIPTTPVNLPYETLHALGVVPGGQKMHEKMMQLTQNVVAKCFSNFEYKLSFTWRLREPFETDYTCGSTVAWPYFRSQVHAAARGDTRFEEELKRNEDFANAFENYCLQLWVWCNPLLHLKGLISDDENAKRCAAVIVMLVSRNLRTGLGTEKRYRSDMVRFLAAVEEVNS